jgi:outer membrane protein TolC
MRHHRIFLARDLAPAPGAARRGRAGLLASVAAAALALAGCTLRPEPLTAEQMLAQSSADRARLFQGQEAPSGPISLEEAQARALRYNLDARLAAHEQAVQHRQVELAPFDLLPRVTASAGYVARDRENVTTSFSRSTGQVSNDTFIGVERNRALADLGFSWNLLDFGASYYQARQQADRALIAGERRRKTIQSMFQEVESVYWQAMAAERTLPRLDATLAQTRAALRTAEGLERSRALPPADSLRIQRELLEILRQLEAVTAELAMTRARLSALMGLPPGSRYVLAAAPEEAGPAALPLSLEAMETMALQRRPELRQEAYETRITAAEARRALLQLLPGISLNASVNYDSNTYLLYNNWAEAGLRVAANLVRMASLPQTLRMNEAQAELAETRRLAISMAVLAQVHIAAQQYARAEAQHARAVQIDQVERRLARLATDRRAGEAGSELDRVRDAAGALVAELRRHRAYAELRAARAGVQATLGMDPLPEGAAAASLAELAAAIRAAGARWSAGRVDVAEVAR